MDITLNGHSDSATNISIFLAGVAILEASEHALQVQLLSSASLLIAEATQVISMGSHVQSPISMTNLAFSQTNLAVITSVVAHFTLPRRMYQN